MDWILAAANKAKDTGGGGLTTAQVAALAAIAAAIVTALFTNWRERRQWVREARAAAYLDLIRSFEAMLNAMEVYYVGEADWDEFQERFTPACYNFGATTAPCFLLGSYRLARATETLSDYVETEVFSTAGTEATARSAWGEDAPQGGLICTSTGAKLLDLYGAFMQQARRDLSVPWRRLPKGYFHLEPRTPEARPPGGGRTGADPGS